MSASTEFVTRADAQAAVEQARRKVITSVRSWCNSTLDLDLAWKQKLYNLLERLASNDCVHATAEDWAGVFVRYSEAERKAAAAVEQARREERERWIALCDRAKVEAKNREHSSLGREYWWGVYNEVGALLKEASDE